MFLYGVVSDCCHWLAFCVSHLLCVPHSHPRLETDRPGSRLWKDTLKGHKSWTMVLGLFIQCRLAVNEAVGRDSDIDPTSCSSKLVKFWLPGFVCQVGGWGRLGCLLGLELSLASTVGQMLVLWGDTGILHNHPWGLMGAEQEFIYGQLRSRPQPVFPALGVLLGKYLGCYCGRLFQITFPPRICFLCGLGCLEEVWEHPSPSSFMLASACSL